MGLIAEIIKHCTSQIPSEQNYVVIDKLLSKEHLDEVSDETWQDIKKAGIKVPKKLRSDDFHDDVMKGARDLQEFWPAYANNSRQVKHKEKFFGFTTNSEKVDIPPGLMLQKFNALKAGAEKWLRDHPNGDQKKTEHSQALKDMAERGITEVERLQFKNATQWLLEQKVEKTKEDPHPEPLDPEAQASDEKTIKAFAELRQISIEEARKRLKQCAEKLQQQGRELWPEGYQQMEGREGMKVHINTMIPEQSRPKLALEEAMALQNYCCVSCYALNEVFRDKKFQGLKLASPPTKDQMKLLETKLIEGQQRKWQADIEKENAGLEALGLEIQQHQQQKPAAINDVLKEHCKPFSRDELAKMSNVEFKKKLTELNVPNDLVDLAGAHHQKAFGKEDDLQKKRDRVEELQGFITDPLSTKEGKNCLVLAQEFIALQKAFEKAKPFEPPIPVKRGLRFKTKQDAENYLKKFREAEKSKGMMFPLEGFQSTSTNAIPETGRADKDKGELFFVKLTIMAKKGLDVMPYAGYQHERELLLDQGTMMQVSSPITSKVKDGVTIFKVELQQIVLQQTI